MGLMRPPPPHLTARLRKISQSKAAQKTADVKPALSPMMIQRCLLQRMPLELLKSKYDYLSKNSAPWLSIKLILEKQMFSN